MAEDVLNRRIFVVKGFRLWVIAVLTWEEKTVCKFILWLHDNISMISFEESFSFTLLPLSAEDLSCVRLGHSLGNVKRRVIRIRA